MPKHWFEQWHGAKVPSTVVEGMTGGSTTMSTGITLSLSTKASVGHTHAQADVTNLESTLAALESKISTKAAGAHTHPQSDVVNLTSTLSAISAGLAGKEPANANIQAHVASAHAPSNAQANADITKAEIEAKLTGQIASHSHAGGAGGGIPSTWAVTSTHVLTGSTTMQSVTGLSFAVSSASMYRYEFPIAWQSISSATGLALGINGPAAPVMVVYEAEASSGLGGMLMKNGRAFGVQTIASLGSSAANVDNFAYLGGICRTGGNAGTLQLQFASEVAGSTVSIRGGSVGMLFGPL